LADTAPTRRRSRYKLDTDDSRRRTVDSANPAEPSPRFTTVPSAPWVRCARTNATTSAARTSAGSLATTVKNTFKSYATANVEFSRNRAATDAK